jgi:hypothetical protein
MPGRSDGGAEVEQRHAGYVMLEVEYRGSRGAWVVEGCLLRTALLVQRLCSGGLSVLAQSCLQRFLRPDAVLETTRPAQAGGSPTWAAGLQFDGAQAPLLPTYDSLKQRWEARIC